MYDGKGILKALTPSFLSTCCFFDIFMSDIRGLHSQNIFVNVQDCLFLVSQRESIIYKLYSQINF